MSPFLRGKIWWTRVTGLDGQSKQRSLETGDAATAKEIDGTLAWLRSKHEWALIDAFLHGLISAGQLYNAVRLNTLDKLRASLSDVRMSDRLDAWEKWARGNATQSTVEKYREQIEILLEKLPMLSDLNRSNISLALASLPHSGSTKRRYHAAWSSFFKYLVEIGIVEVNPMRQIQAPRPNRSRELWLSLPDMMRVVDAQPEPFRSLSAFLHGAGVEISAALRVRVRDVDVQAQTVRARGTKTHTRDRLVKVDAWAWPMVMEATQGKMQDALLWPLYDGQERSAIALAKASGMAYRALKRALRADALHDLPATYTVHDARHSYAVRHVKLGTPYKRISHNLGHADELQVIKVYGKHRLSDQEVASQEAQT